MGRGRVSKEIIITDHVPAQTSKVNVTKSFIIGLSSFFFFLSDFRSAAQKKLEFDELTTRIQAGAFK